MSTNTFNLIDDPWLPVVYRDGVAKEVSLTTVFSEAPLIREISGDIPQQTLPLLRVLLAILYRAYYADVDFMTDEELRKDWSNTWEAGHFDMEDINAYLKKYHDRFNLLDEQHPFFQVPDLKYATKKKHDPISEIIADVPKPDKFLFSLRSKEGLTHLSFSEAARWLVFLAAYDPAGIKTPVIGNTHVNKGKVYAPKGAVGTGWLGALGGVYLESDNLFSTLMLNWCLVSNRAKDKSLVGNPEDKPAWEKTEKTSDIQVCNEPNGPAELFTWQDRRMRLEPNSRGDCIQGIVICYGDILTAADKQAFEMMTAWRESATKSKQSDGAKASQLPRRLDSSKALWRGLEPILKYAAVDSNDFRPMVIAWAESMRGRINESSKPLTSFSIHSQGMSYGTQSSVFDDSIDDKIDIQPYLLQHDSAAVNEALRIIDSTEKAVYELSNFVKRIEEVKGDKDTASYTTDVKEVAYDNLDAIFRERIAGFSEEKDVLSYGKDWLDQVHRLLIKLGNRYLADSGVSPFVVRDGPRMANLSAPRSRRLFFRALNQILGEMQDSTTNKQQVMKGE